jgi:phage FluMu protein gp41
VTERAATAWQRTGALKPENAEALAQVFNVDFDYIWSGPRPDTPEMFVERRGPVAVNEVKGELDERIARMEAKLDEASSDRQVMLDLLARQDVILAKIEAAISAETALRKLLDETAARQDQAARETLRLLAELQAGGQTGRAAPRKNAS